jgi:hypothetical protein
VQVSHDDRGPYLVLPFERADDVRALLISLGIGFDDEQQDGAGCAGPVWVVLRLDAASLDRCGGVSMLEQRL